ncbi:hypothetical protein [Couchioplanes caeruleus]|uniref:Uncharacterized protein n=2 Tax=Couchioplanes caeruleus TaxID=56438 RepID=A0A1K0FC42_9ACTN|nr:hypothetical protein [Couchioplanes caeruleus]OJF10397.1 hypothetical protein BG844_32190 [Couchioplanes caeruleus subsp. caeruleus]ROP29783.1 hypothetical protein EDD30_2598 [Couchioplanes caeruleus]
MTAAVSDCLFCIEGHMPAGRDESMGELFETCPACRIPCGFCDGIAVYPTNYDTPTELVIDLLTLRLAPVFCPGCYGVIAVISLGSSL